MHLLIHNGLQRILLQLTGNVLYSTRAGIQRLGCELGAVLQALARLQRDPRQPSRWGVCRPLQLCHASRSWGLAMRPPPPKPPGFPHGPSSPGKECLGEGNQTNNRDAWGDGDVSSPPSSNRNPTPNTSLCGSSFFRGCLNITWV